MLACDVSHQHTCPFFRMIKNKIVSSQWNTISFILNWPTQYNMMVFKWVPEMNNTKQCVFNIWSWRWKEKTSTVPGLRDSRFPSYSSLMNHILSINIIDVWVDSRIYLRGNYVLTMKLRVVLWIHDKIIWSIEQILAAPIRSTKVRHLAAMAQELFPVAQWSFAPRLHCSWTRAWLVVPRTLSTLSIWSDVRYKQKINRLILSTDKWREWACEQIPRSFVYLRRWYSAVFSGDWAVAVGSNIVYGMDYVLYVWDSKIYRVATVETIHGVDWKQQKVHLLALIRHMLMFNSAYLLWQIVQNCL